MGGGGGGGRNTLGDIRALEEKAKAALRESQEGKRNVFISFAYEDVGEVNLLRGHASNENSEIEFRDYSVTEPYNSERAAYIKLKLEERINQTSTTVVYLTDNTKESGWVKWEVEKSIELGKRVVAMHKGDAPPAGLPGWVSQNSIEVVSWSQLADRLRK